MSETVDISGASEDRVVQGAGAIVAAQELWCNVYEAACLRACSSNSDDPDDVSTGEGCRAASERNSTLETSFSLV